MDTGSSRGRGAFSARPLTIVLVFLVLTCGCLGSGGNGTTSTPGVATKDPTRTDTADTVSPSTADKPPAGLHSRLFQLALAENRTAYAATHGLDVRDGRVLVVVTLAPNRSIPDRFAVETELTRDNEVLGYVRIDDLTDLARSPAIARIDPPERGTTNRITASQQRTHLTDT